MVVVVFFFYTHVTKDPLISLLHVGTVLGAWFLYRRIKNWYGIRSRTYEWYKETYPSAIKNGRVTCVSCGHHQIHVRSLMQGQYRRAHFCVQCGKTLYYTPE